MIFFSIPSVPRNGQFSRNFWERVETRKQEPVEADIYRDGLPDQQWGLLYTSGAGTVLAETLERCVCLFIANSSERPVECRRSALYDFQSHVTSATS